MKRAVWLGWLLLAALLAGCAPTDIPAADTPAPAPLPSPTAAPTQEIPVETEAPNMDVTLLYQGHGSLRVVTGDGKVIYIDPYAGQGYDLPADLILITHGHSDHTAVERIESQAPGCQTITYKEALVKGEHKTFGLDFVTVEAVEAGNNPNHDIKVCVGFVLTFPGGQSVYISGDTSTTDQMAELAERALDCAFFCCDGIYNMDIPEAADCAGLVAAKRSVPYHMAPGKDFDRARAERFQPSGALILEPGQELVL